MQYRHCLDDRPISLLAERIVSVKPLTTIQELFSSLTLRCLDGSHIDFIRLSAIAQTTANNPSKNTPIPKNCENGTLGRLDKIQQNPPSVQSIHAVRIPKHAFLIADIRLLPASKHAAPNMATVIICKMLVSIFATT